MSKSTRSKLVIVLVVCLLALGSAAPVGAAVLAPKAGEVAVFTGGGIFS